MSNTKNYMIKSCLDTDNYIALITDCQKCRKCLTFTYVISMSLILLYNQSKCYMKSRLQTTARHAKIVITPYNLKRAFLFPFKLAFDSICYVSLQITSILYLVQYKTLSYLSLYTKYYQCVRCWFQLKHCTINVRK